MRVIFLIFIIYSKTFGIYVVHFIYQHLGSKEFLKANYRMIQTNNSTYAKIQNKKHHKISEENKVLHCS